MKVDLADDKRRMSRKTLCYYLRVIDLKSGKELGRVGDITTEGMMIFGNVVLDKEKTYLVRVILANSIFNMSLGNLDVSVEIRWSKPDANPALILTGMFFHDLDDRGKKIVKNLVEKIGIKRRLDITDEDIENGISDVEEE